MVDYNDAERYQRSEKWRDIPCIGRFKYKCIYTVSQGIQQGFE